MFDEKVDYILKICTVVLQLAVVQYVCVKYTSEVHSMYRKVQ